MIADLTHAEDRRVLFADSFGSGSQGVRERNRVSDPPPEGMDYPTGTPHGFSLKNWLVADAEPNGPRRSFWCIPESEDGTIASVMEQAGRSRNSIVYARSIIPKSVTRFTIEFRQRVNDNDYIGFIIGASQPLMRHDGLEFGYERQKPGTDETTSDVYYRGDLGEGIVPDMAFMRRWVSHRIEVNGHEVRWYQDDALTLSGQTSKKLSGGYFGIRQKYERGTRYDDFQITTTERADLQRPNVLFIAVDDLRCDLGCYGVDQVQSPHLDKLASESVLFTHAYCQYPLCNPSRTSVLTGLRPDATDMNRDEIQNDFHFRSKIPNVETLPQMFQRHGYRVGRVGKIFHYGVPREIGTESLLDDRASWQFSVYPRGGEKDEDEQLISYTPERNSGWALSWQVSRTPAERHTDSEVADQAIDRLRELKSGPFFLAVGFFRPHVPSTAPAEYFDPYPLNSIFLPDSPREHLQLIPDAASRPIMRVDTAREDLRRFKRAYYATITLVDQQIGRLVDSLDTLELSDNTIVVLWSDHGFLLGEHDQWMKPYLFEQCVRSPLMIRVPGKRGNGTACNRIVELVDLYPTLAELCGLKPPANLAGKSLIPLLDDPTSAWIEEAYSQVGSRHSVGYSVRTPRWRYTEWGRGQEGRELYDYETDPGELVNLATQEAYAEIVEKLSQRLASYQVKSP